MNSDEQSEGMKTLFATIQDSVFSSFDIEPPETKGAEMVEDPRQEWERHLEAFMFIVRLLLPPYTHSLP